MFNMQLITVGKELIDAIRDVGLNGQPGLVRLRKVLEFHASQVEEPDLARGLATIARALPERAE